MRIYQKTSQTPDNSSVFPFEKGSGESWNTYKVSWSSMIALIATAQSISWNGTTGQLTLTKSDGTTVTITCHDGTKQDKLTFDNTPTSGSTNPVTSGGIYEAIATLERGLDWKESVATYNDIATTYPNPEDGWTVTVKDTDQTYRYSGTEWVNIFGLISVVTTTKDGLMSASDKVKLNGIEAGANKITVDSALNTSSTNPVQNAVISNKIESIESDIASLQDYLGIPYIVGSEFDFKNKTYTRLASSVGLSGGDDFDNFPQYNLRRCNLANDGTVNAYYGDSNYIEDGSNGQVMVEIPRFYYRVEPVELEKAARGYHLRKAKYYISPYPVPGFKIHPAFVLPDGRVLDKFYYSAYEGCLYDTSDSAYITDDSGVMDSTVDLLSSISGAKPASGKSQVLDKTNLEKLATNRGDGWHLSTIKAEMAITMLMMIEYNTLEFQSVIGNGVSSISDDGSSNSAVVTGATSSLGNKTGMASGTDGLVSISYRGIENPYANIWKHINGINFWGDGTMQGGEIFIANDFNFNESSNSGNYEEVGFYLPNSYGWINAFGYSKEEFDWLLIPSEVGGNSALPIGDYNWVTVNLNGYRIALLGGRWDDGLYCSRSYWGCHNGVGYRSRGIGGRVLYFGKM